MYSVLRYLGNHTVHCSNCSYRFCLSTRFVYRSYCYLFFDRFPLFEPSNSITSHFEQGTFFTRNILPVFTENYYTSSDDDSEDEQEKIKRLKKERKTERRRKRREDRKAMDGIGRRKGDDDDDDDDD